jgi:hypothetical protein
MSYPPPGYTVRIPDSVWDGALATVCAYSTLGVSKLGERGSEALVYLGGMVADQEMIVTGLYRLNHAPQGNRVAVTREEARWLVHTLRRRDEKLIGQLHSHRGAAGHSAGDDAWATSFHEGFLSIVVPRFGAAVSAPADCAVLEYRGGEFVPLGAREVERRINVVAGIVEPGHAVLGDRARAEGRWRAFVVKLKSIARKPR